MLHLRPVAPVRVDEHLVQLRWARLRRHGDQLTLECENDDVEAASSLLFRAGVDATPGVAAIDGLDRSVPAEVADLSPLPRADLFDIVVMRSLASGEATARLSHARWWRFGRSYDASVRGILRGDDRLFAWWRVVWARPSTLRSRDFRRARPLIFDRQSVERRPEHFTLARNDLLTRWIGA